MSEILIIEKECRLVGLGGFKYSFYKDAAGSGSPNTTTVFNEPISELVLIC
ncbi:hypothetical protein [Alkalibacterium subtropicum]|uniref:hypothetical protein n=1 Tax=Alkalibacterium subtropicum TaxID=753702 RepID=UPI0015A50B0B|nr:hypothetical protein [Alkalibacterium subtropicum]